MKRTVALLSSLPLLFWIAQGCSSTADTTGGNTSGDDGGGSGTGDDAGGGGPGTDGGGGGTKKDGGGDGGGVVVQTTPGTSLVSGKLITLYGVTSDGYVVFGKDTGKADDAGTALSDLEVVPVAGGAPIVLSPVLDFSVDDFAIAGKTIAYYKNVDQSGIAATLSVWSAANATLKQVGTNALDGLYDASEDGTHVVFTQNVDAVKKTADFTVSKADGTTPVAMITGFSLANCGPDAGFRKAIVYATACTGAVKTASIATLDTGTAGATVTKTAGTVAKPGFASLDANGTHLLYIKNTNLVGTVAAFDGGAPVAHSPNTAFATLNTDASKLIYRATLADGGPGELGTSPAAQNNPTVLVPTVLSVPGISPDFANGIVTLKPADVATNKDIPRRDLNLASLTTAGVPKVLTAAGGPVGFSSTSTHFFYLTDLPTTGKLPIATLNAHPIAGGTDKVVAKLIIEPKLVDTTSKAAYMENIQQDADGNVFVDLSVGDGAGAGMPAVVVQGADPGFYLSGTKMIYTNAAKGLYVVAVP